MLCVKITMIIFNVIFCLIGLAGGIVGAVFFVKQKGKKENFEGMNEYCLNEKGVTQDEAISLMVFGFGLFVVSFLSLTGAACDSVCLLITYIVAVVVVLIGAVVIGSLYLIWRGEKYREPQIKAYRDDCFLPVYNASYTDVDALAWVIKVQSNHTCCGCNSITDYHPQKQFLQQKGRWCSSLANETCCNKTGNKLFNETASLKLYLGIGFFVSAAIEIMAIIFACVAATEQRKRLRA